MSFISIIFALNAKCIIVDSDWGGIMGYVVAALNPTLVTKLIIMNAPHPNVTRKLREVSMRQAILPW